MKHRRLLHVLRSVGEYFDIELVVEQGIVGLKQVQLDSAVCTQFDIEPVELGIVVLEQVQLESAVCTSFDIGPVEQGIVVEEQVQFESVVCTSSDIELAEDYIVVQVLLIKIKFRYRGQLHYRLSIYISYI